MHAHGAVSAAPKHLSCFLPDDEQAAVGQEAQARRLVAVERKDLLLGAVGRVGEDGASIQIGHPPAPVVPAGPLEVLSARCECVQGV